MYRKTYARIDGKILENNVKEIKKKYSDYKYYFGVVKNNAYGHGMRVVQNLIRGGINYFAVSSLEEALLVRKYTQDIPVLVLEPVDVEFIDDVLNNKITITIESLDYLKSLNKIDLSYEVKIHLKLDTGMNRLGIKTSKEVKEAVKIISKNDKLFLEGIYTHFATTGVNDFYYDRQVEKFLHLTSEIDLASIPIVHLDRSLTFVTHEKLAFANGVRLGIAMFGFSGSRTFGTGFKAKLRSIKRNMYLKKYHISKTILENDLQLSTAFSLYSSVMSLRKVQKGDVVGYNASYQVKEESFIATIPIGYADGVSKEFGFVSIRNKKYPIVADAMDMIMVLVDESVKIKDKVEIFGDTITIHEVKGRLNTNAQHLFSGITTRVPRVHVDGKDEVEIKY